MHRSNNGNTPPPSAAGAAPNPAPDRGSREWERTVRFSSKITKCTWLYLLHRANAKGQTWPSINTIARDTHCSRSSIFRALGELEQRGLIKRRGTSGQKRPNLYTIVHRTTTPEKHCATSGVTVRPDATSGVTVTPLRCHSETPQVSQCDPEDTNEVRHEVDPDPHRTNVQTETEGTRTNGAAATRSPGNGLAADESAKQALGAEQVLLVQEAYDQYRETADAAHVLPPPRLTPRVAGKIADTLEALGGPHGGLIRWQDMLERVEQTPFLTGRSADANGRLFRARLGWLCKAGTAAAVLAGRYDPYPQAGSET